MKRTVNAEITCPEHFTSDDRKEGAIEYCKCWPIEEKKWYKYQQISIPTEYRKLRNDVFINYDQICTTRTFWQYEKYNNVFEDYFIHSKRSQPITIKKRKYTPNKHEQHWDSNQREMYNHIENLKFNLLTFCEEYHTSHGVK